MMVKNKLVKTGCGTGAYILSWLQLWNSSEHRLVELADEVGVTGMGP